MADIVVRVSTGLPGPPGVGVPAGGTTGQVLAKATDANYDDEWIDVAGGGASVVQEGDTIVVSAATTLDFLAADFNITESPTGEANIALATDGIREGDAAGGDLGGTYPDPTVNNDSHTHGPSTITGTTTDGQVLRRAAGAVGWGAVDLADSDAVTGVLPDGNIPATIARDAEITAAVSAAVAALIDGAPGALDTLNELAAALGDDPNFATTITNLIAAKLSLSLYDANTILVANSDNTPAALTVGEATVVGRATGGNIAALTAAQVRTILTLVIGTNVQAWDADLDSIAALTTTSVGRSLLAGADAAALRTILALGNAATLNVGTTAGTVAAGDDVRFAGAPGAHAASHQDGGADELALDGSQITAGTVADARIASTIARDDEVAAGYQPLDSDLTAIAALATQSVGRSLLAGADAAALRTILALGTIATQSAAAAAITGGTITGITDLAIADGGTGASTATAARTNLEVANSLTAVAQSGHGLAVGNPIYHNGTAYAKAQADTAAKAEVVGLVTAVADANNFTFATTGLVTGLSGLTAGTVYFLSAATAGAITATEPSTVGEITKPVLVAVSTTSGYFYNFRGAVIGAGALTTEQLQDLVGAMVSGGTETGIAVTYDDTNARLDFVAEVTQAELDAITRTDEQLQDLIGAMVSGGTETGIAVTYDDTNARFDFVAEVTQAELDTANTTIVANNQTASYTLVLTDAGKVVEMNNASANNLTVPLNSSVAYPTGTVIELWQQGAGQTTVVATGGVTIRSRGAALKLHSQYASATLRKVGTDEWVLAGDVTT